jgi:hypothetical protein
MLRSYDEKVTVSVGRLCYVVEATIYSALPRSVSNILFVLFVVLLLLTIFCNCYELLYFVYLKLIVAHILSTAQVRFPKVLNTWQGN